jgi:hypothetical protein
LLAPNARAASTNSFSRSERNWARTSLATGIQRKAADDDDDEDEDAALRPEHHLEGILEEIHHEQEQRQLRQRQEQVGEPHQGGADGAARHARDGADDGAHADGDEHGGEPHGQRNSPAIDHARQKVLAEVVGAERMRPRRSLQARREVDLVDRHPPHERSQRNRQHHHDQDRAARQCQAVAAEPAPGVQPRREMRGAGLHGGAGLNGS